MVDILPQSKAGPPTHSTISRQGAGAAGLTMPLGTALCTTEIQLLRMERTKSRSFSRMRDQVTCHCEQSEESAFGCSVKQLCKIGEAGSLMRTGLKSSVRECREAGADLWVCVLPVIPFADLKVCYQLCIAILMDRTNRSKQLWLELLPG